MSEHALVMDQQGETEPGEPYADERSATMYAELCKHLPTFEKNRLSYLKQGQVIGRLNAVLGFDGWSFEIVEHGYREDADELWVRGRLTVYGPRRTVIREQFGSQKHNRLRDGKTIIDLGFDLKGATSDSFKKCCQAIGIGLWLASDEEAAEPVAEKAPPADNRVACEGCLKLVERVSINMGKCTSCRSIADKQRREREAAEAAAKKPASPTVPVQDARQKLGLPAEKQPTPIDSEPPVVTQFYDACQAALQLDRAAVLKKLNATELKAALAARGYPNTKAGLFQLYDTLALIVDDEQAEVRTEAVEA